MSVKSGNLVVESGTITATGRDAAGSSGIYASGNITIKNGAVTATDNSYGLQARNWEIGEIGTGSMDFQGMTAAYSVNGNNSGEKEYATGKRVLKSRDFNFIAPTDLIYDGQGKTASVTPKTGISCGEVTVKYYGAAGNCVTGTPTEVGTYVVKVDVCVYFCPEHKFGSVDYTWNRDEKGDIISCTASGTCSNCNEKVTETADVTTEINRTQSCTEPEYTRYSANYTNSEFSYYEDIKTKSALGHTQAADDGDCTTPVTCERCNHIYVEAKAHNWSDSWEKDGSGHWHICQNEGCKEVEKSNHTPDREAATEDADQVCADCRQIITNKLGHVHKIHLEKVEAKEVTCTEEGNQAYYKCTEDQKCFLDENAETEVYESDMKIQEAGHRAGDNSDVMLWLILALSSAGAILWFGTRRKQGR